jgi:hypothetical protein
MGFKIYIIAITNAVNVSVTDIPKKIGFDELKPENEISINEAQRENGISIGKHNETIFIVCADLVFQFYNKEQSDLEKRLIKEFPESEIAILALDQTTDFFGYNIISKGKRQRVVSGVDSELEIDFGEKIPEESEVTKDPFFNFFLEELNEIKAIDKDFTEKKMKSAIKHEIGVRSFFKLTSRYFEKAIDEIGSNFSKIKVTRFE